MKLKLEDIKVKSFVTKELVNLKGGGEYTEAQNCTSPAVCGGGTGLFCPTNWCPSDWTECGYTDLC